MSALRSAVAMKLHRRGAVCIHSMIASAIGLGQRARQRRCAGVTSRAESRHAARGVPDRSTRPAAGRPPPKKRLRTAALVRDAAIVPAQLERLRPLFSDADAPTTRRPAARRIAPCQQASRHVDPRGVPSTHSWRRVHMPSRPHHPLTADRNRRIRFGSASRSGIMGQANLEGARGRVGTWCAFLICGVTGMVRARVSPRAHRRPV